MASKVKTHLGTNGISTNGLHDEPPLVRTPSSMNNPNQHSLSQEPTQASYGRTRSAGSDPSSPAQTSTNPSSAPPPSGISMLIVGAGFAGLACAIEGVRKGHDVLVLERWAGPGTGDDNQLGDVLSLGPNAGRIVERWGLHDRLWPICGHATSLKIHDLPGTLLHTQPLPATEFGAHAYNGRRGEMHTVLLEHALQLGVKVRWGVEVGSYWESGAATHDETRLGDQETDGPGSDAGVPLQVDSDRAGVVLTSNERLEADVVVAADGVWSAARGYVLVGVDVLESFVEDCCAVQAMLLVLILILIFHFDFNFSLVVFGNTMVALQILVIVSEVVLRPCSCLLQVIPLPVSMLLLDWQSFLISLHRRDQGSSVFAPEDSEACSPFRSSYRRYFPP